MIDLSGLPRRFTPRNDVSEGGRKIVKRILVIASPLWAGRSALLFSLCLITVNLQAAPEPKLPPAGLEIYRAWFKNLRKGLPNPLDTNRRLSSAPYLSCDTFRSVCRHFFDECGCFEPSRVQERDTIFVNGDLLELFFTYLHPQIQHPYVLVTQNTDDGAPGRFRDHLNDPKIIAWFGQNCDATGHAKFIPIPIGLANSYWRHGNTSIVQRLQDYAKRSQREWFMIMNFRNWTNGFERTAAFDAFKDQPYCKTFIETNGVGFKTDYASYLTDLAEAKFVISPHGHGLDCVRTWEALWMGAIPIVKTSTLDSMYENLPVVIVKNWTDATKDFLDQQYLEIQANLLAGKYQLEKL